jgi:EGF domain
LPIGRQTNNMFVSRSLLSVSLLFTSFVVVAHASTNSSPDTNRDEMEKLTRTMVSSFLRATGSRKLQQQQISINENNDSHANTNESALKVSTATAIVPSTVPTNSTDDTNTTTTNTTTLTIDNSVTTDSAFVSRRGQFVCGKNAVLNKSGNGCKCRPGYHRDPKTRRCVDTNECTMNRFNKIPKICGPNARCTNTIGSYTCRCNSGYTKGDPYNMVTGCFIGCDYPEGSPCGPDHTCHDTPTGYECKQLPGIDACPIACSPHESCLRNTKTAKYSCQCDDGYYRPNPYFPCRIKV